MWLITFQKDIATMQRVPDGKYPTGEMLTLDGASGEAFDSFERALKIFTRSIKLAYDMEEGQTKPRQPDPTVLVTPGQQVWVVERAPLWCEISKEVVGENGKVLVRRFGTSTELDLDADRPKDMGYDDAIGWAFSDPEDARELKRTMDRTRWR